MSQDDQGNNLDALSNAPLKRKRGRPRKYPQLNLEENDFVPPTQNLNSGENAGIGIPPIPPGFQSSNGYQPHRAAPVNGTTDVMVGTVVSGVIDAAFDGGYLLSVRVGNSHTTLRGVVFKPGRYVSISSENDVAPDVQMIRRNAIPIPAKIYSHSRGQKRRSRDAIRSVNHVASKGKHAPPAATQTVNPLLSRGNLLPVILQPRNLSDGVPLSGISTSVERVAPPSNGSIPTHQVPLTAGSASVPIQTADLENSKVTQVPPVPPPSNGSMPTNQMPVGNQSLVFEGGKSENGTCNQLPKEALLQAEAKSMRLPDMPFEKLVTEVVKRTNKPSQTSSQSAEVDIEGSTSMNSMDQPLAVEPLQVIKPFNLSIPPSEPPVDGRHGKMSELLQVLQESMSESEVPQAEVSTTSSRLKLDEPSKIALRDKEPDR